MENKLLNFIYNPVNSIQICKHYNLYIYNKTNLSVNININIYFVIFARGINTFGTPVYRSSIYFVILYPCLLFHKQRITSSCTLTSHSLLKETAYCSNYFF